jgi:hypothetical protein
MNEPTRLNAEEVARLTDQAAHLFVARHVRDYYPCNLNSNKMMGFIFSQLGEDYPYPLNLEHFESAFAYISQHDFFLPRPVEEEVVDEAAALEARKQQQVRDNHDAQQRAAKIQRDKSVPLNLLRNEVGVQNKDFRQQRDANLLPVRQPGSESRSLATVTFGLKAQARNAVALANPSLNRNSEAFAKLYAAELSRLRS